MVAQTGLGKQLADGERKRAELKRKAHETKEKLRKGAKGTQPGTNKPQKPLQLDTVESQTKQEKPVKQKENNPKPPMTHPGTNKPHQNPNLPLQLRRVVPVRWDTC